MRVARQHPLHLQVPARNNNGKFLVGPNAGSQDAVHQQLSPRQQPQPQQPAGDESSAVVPPSCVFPTCESVPTDLHGGPTILGDRFLLLGPAEGSALYRCVDVHSGQQLVAKVSAEGPFIIRQFHNVARRRASEWPSRILFIYVADCNEGQQLADNLPYPDIGALNSRFVIASIIDGELFIVLIADRLKCYLQ